MTIHAFNADVSEAQVASFNAKGYVCLRGALNAQEVSTLQGAMIYATNTLGSSPNAYDLTAAADQVWSSAGTVDDQGSVQHDLGALAQAVRKSGKPRLIDPAVAKMRGNFLLDTSVWRRTPALGCWPPPCQSSDRSHSSK